ncbi:unnamed protein product [Ambrosiozyma monospora]|uniref:Unnamed protein product n=1 Tax=Ambrosiozyma monospora TaxID=43982 RepID=A0A9W6WI24_AMBMO|nr:unnamed protein product [Ambrosiozyma monospora]
MLRLQKAQQLQEISFDKLESITHTQLSSNMKAYMSAFIQPPFKVQQSQRPKLVNVDQQLNDELFYVKRCLLMYLNDYDTGSIQQQQASNNVLELEFYITMRRVQVEIPSSSSSAAKSNSASGSPEIQSRCSNYFLMMAKIPTTGQLMVVGIVTVLPGMDYCRLTSFIVGNSIDWSKFNGNNGNGRNKGFSKIKIHADEPLVELFNANYGFSDMFPCHVSIDSISQQLEVEMNSRSSNTFGVVGGNNTVLKDQLERVYRQLSCVLSVRCGLMDSDDLLLNSLIGLGFVG